MRTIVLNVQKYHTFSKLRRRLFGPAPGGFSPQLFHVRTESLRTPVSISGKRDSAARDRGAERASRQQLAIRRDRIHGGIPAKSGHLACIQEISVRGRVRGGPGRSGITEPLLHDSSRVRAKEPRCVDNRISNGARTRTTKRGRYVCHASP